MPWFFCFFLMAFTGQSDVDSALLLSGIYTGKEDGSQWGGASRGEKVDVGKGLGGRSGHACYLNESMQVKDGEWNAPGRLYSDSHRCLLLHSIRFFCLKISLWFCTPTWTVFQHRAVMLSADFTPFFVVFFIFWLRKRTITDSLAFLWGFQAAVTCNKFDLSTSWIIWVKCEF